MNIYVWLGVIVLIMAVIEGFTEKDVLAGVLVGLFSVGIGLFVASSITTFVVGDINYSGVEKGLKLVVNSDITNNEIEYEIRNLINSSTDNKAFNVLIEIADSDTIKLKVKKVDIKLKYPILTKYIYKNEKKSFTILIKNNELQKDSIEIIEVK